MAFVINRSTPPETVQKMRKIYQDQGYIEAINIKEARRLENEGKIVFIDHTNNGVNSFRRERMYDFKENPIE